jgi:hypothetical protein
MKNTGTLKVTTPTDREIVLTRVFDAPRHLVFDAFSKPELLKRWFGPHGWSLVVCEVDLKVGGGFRFVLRGPDGQEMGMRGVYRETHSHSALSFAGGSRRGSQIRHGARRGRELRQACGVAGINGGSRPGKISRRGVAPR